MSNKHQSIWAVWRRWKQKNETCHTRLSALMLRGIIQKSCSTRHTGLVSYASSYTYISSRRFIRVLKFTKQRSNIASKSLSYRPASYRLSILHKQLHRSIALFPSTCTRHTSWRSDCGFNEIINEQFDQFLLRQKRQINRWQKVSDDRSFSRKNVLNKNVFNQRVQFYHFSI